MPKTVLASVSRFHVWVFPLLFVGSLLPFVIMGDGSHVIIHDNLDGEVIRKTVLAREGKVFAHNSTVNQVMNGIPRSSFSSGFNITSILFSLFPPFRAYLVNHLLVHTVAFLGMLRLLKRHVVPGKPGIYIGLAFCFSVLPFYSMFGLSVAGQPLLLSAVLNSSRSKAGILDWTVIIMFPLWSYLVQVGVFVLGTLSVWSVWELLRRKRLNTGLAACVLVMGLLYGILERSLISDVLIGGGYTSHRVEWSTWDAAKSYGLASVGVRAVTNFLNGQYHAASLHKISLLTSIPLALFLALKRQEHRVVLLLARLLGLCLLFSLILTLQRWRGLIPIKERLPFLYSFQFGRFHWLHPVLWFLVISFALDAVYRSDVGELGGGHLISVVLLTAQCLFVATRNQELVNTSEALVLRLLGRDHPSISWSEFYSEELFEEIDRYIREPKADFRVASIGLHPAVGAYNGFWTLDFYTGNYPLRYKHQFRRIIEKELKKSDRWRLYFDGWGSRCYVLASELDGFMITKASETKIKNLELNTDAFAEMGGRYLLSAVEIENYRENNLVFERAFEAEKSPWRVWLYRVADDPQQREDEIGGYRSIVGGHTSLLSTGKRGRLNATDGAVRDGHSGLPMRVRVTAATLKDTDPDGLRASGSQQLCES